MKSSKFAKKRLKRNFVTISFITLSSIKNYSVSDWNWTRIYYHLVHNRTLNHLAKLTKWLSRVVSTYLYGAFNCMFLSCHVLVPEWIYTLWLSACQGTPCSKQARNQLYWSRKATLLQLYCKTTLLKSHFDIGALL